MDKCFNKKNIFLLCKILYLHKLFYMARPKKQDKDKVKLVAAYLTDSEKKQVLKKFKSLTVAVREKILVTK